jgi:NitT/TauT family transport system permease protein/sulfonate transport system permease protein
MPKAAERTLAEGLVVAALAGWWLMSRDLPAYVLPDPWMVAKTLWRLFFDMELAPHTLATTLRVASSVVIAVAIGGALALVPLYVPVLDHVIHGRIQPMLNSVPSVGWAILAVIWFDISNFSVMFVQVVILLPFCLINISEGIREMDRELLEMARSFTRSGPQVFAKIIVPLLVPYVLAATRMAYGIGWKIALVSELFGADTGLGFLMIQAQTVSDAAMVLATCLGIVVIFTLGDRLLLNPLTRLYSTQGALP